MRGADVVDNLVDLDRLVALLETASPETLATVVGRLMTRWMFLALNSTPAATFEAGSKADDADQLVTVEEAAAFLSLPTSYVAELGRRGKLPRVSHGKYVRFRRGDLRAWVGAHRTPGECGPSRSGKRSDGM